MKDENSRDSELDLNRILEEYSAIGRDKSRNTERASGNGTNKKFVLHIDESLVDSQSEESSAKPQGNSGGIYFSNYQKNRNVQQQKDIRPVQQKKPVQTNTAEQNNRKATDSSNGKNNASKKKSIGGRAALIFLAVIIVTTSILSYVGITCVGDMLAINRSDESVEITIPEDSNYEEVIDILYDNDLIKNKLFCKLFTQYRDFDEETYLSGKYYLQSSMGLEGMLRDMMVSPVTAETIKLSFPEGWTVQQIFEKLEKNDVSESSKLYSTIRSNYSYDFYNEIEDDNKRYLKLEGYLFPDTYDFYVGADTNYVIKKFLDNFESKWTDEYQARADKLGYTCDEIIIIASIIQKEADNVEQMKTISSIIHNRLNNDARYPTLGCDSTGLYVSNYVTPVVGDAAGLSYYSYYDTRSNKGLPPGPICNPGMDAIKAALYPDSTNYYYFAHDNSGKIYLAETLDGHNTNLVKIIQANNKD